MNKKTFSFIIILAVAYFQLLSTYGNNDSSSVKLYSLEESINYALENNANIKNASLDIKKSKKKVLETTAIGLPQVSASVNYQNIFKVPVMTMGGFGPSTETTMELGVKENITTDLNISQLLFSGEYIVGLQAAKIYKQLSNETYTKTTADIIELVKQNYYLVLIAEENLKITQKSFENIEIIYNETNKMFEAGFVDETDKDQLKLTMTNLKNTISTIEKQVNITYDLLKIQMGISPENTIRLSDKLESIILKINVKENSSKKFNVEEHIDYKLFNTQEKLTQLSLRREKSTLLPNITSFYRHQYLQNEPEFNFNPKDVFGITANIPIFGSGIKVLKIQQAKIELDKIRNSKFIVKQNLELLAKTTQNDYSTALENYTNNIDNLELSKKIYNQTLIKFKNGMASSLELSQAHNQNLTTQSNYLSSILDVLNAKNKLDKINNKY